MLCSLHHTLRTPQLRPSRRTWRERLVANESDLVRVPDPVCDATAATAGVNPPTALRMLREFVSLDSGDVVVQNAANSGVGRAVIEIAASMGIKTLNVVRERPDMDQLRNELTQLG